MAWSMTRSTVADVVGPADDLILFCGVSVGYAAEAAPVARTGRAALTETVTFVGGDQRSENGRTRRLVARTSLSG
jgi:hypothetical protein